ncbi:TonB-dependent siderophore receptor [Musicola paradisiaca]|uniref:TonB-dependent siderophore receptor n=1 Tax=Musicola paradisiaca (strain Ech703) TaxID=579405 RepID=C6C9P0_MUSP7|nr:TonB-dependent siderophore receptor [Musicola paradisiaca]ACS84491.1 TonB-dependent siderophore receptor [Musicola paradisiaca Ech703]
MMTRRPRHYLATLIGLSCAAFPSLNWAAATDATATTVTNNTAAGTPLTSTTSSNPASTNDAGQTQGDTMVVTAAEQTRQAPGVSVMTAEDIAKRAPTNDLSEIIRTQPGVNLTGNSTSGQRGNNRQIDIRGMGPENTLILVDGKPISSRNAVRYGWRGERDTRGDTNWVPSDMVERIEVLRGPAAARYGSGAMGGVINIITKQPTQAWHGSWNTYFNVPVHKAEGATKRTDFSLSGGLSDSLSLRLYGNLNKTQADAADINEPYKSARTGSYASSVPAGREGVRNKDINGVLRWDITRQQSLEFEMGSSRQGNIYAGDTQNTNSNSYVSSNYGKETNRMYRQNYAVTHRGFWDSGVSSTSYLQYERTQNTRISEGLAGGTEGIFSSADDYTTIKLDALTAHSEVNIPFDAYFNQTVTLGVEASGQRMTDPSSSSYDISSTGAIAGYSSKNRSGDINAHTFSVFAEDNVELTQSTMLTPALRFDYHSLAGSKVSPGLNLSQGLGDDVTLKMGIAQAYKAPNLYQVNPNYLLYSRGQGCYLVNGASNNCYLIGNEDLKAETSVNKEIGLEFKRYGYQAGVTYFRNDYRNKIESGLTPVGTTTDGKTYVYRWENIPRAVVEGLEGTLNVPVSESVTWHNNITYMLRSKNKSTGDILSVTPAFTLNSTLSWQATDDLSLQSTLTWYGRQKPKKYNYRGMAASGDELNELSPYAVVGTRATYTINKNVSVTGGVSNLFDKRQFRRGNASAGCTVASNGSCSAITIAGAGAATYNEPGRTFYMSINTHF